MRYRIARITISLALLAFGWHLHVRAIDLLDEAIGNLHDNDPLPQGRADLVFGEGDPRELAERPENRVKLFRARLIDISAGLCCVASAYLLFTSFIPRIGTSQKEPPCASADS